MWNLKNILQMNLFTKQKQTHGHRKGESRGTHYHVQNKLQGYVVQHKEYNQYFIITENEVKPLKL